MDPVGKHFVLSVEGKGAIAVFLLAGIWWVFEVVPIGVTSLVIGVTQALFMIRPAKEAFNDFMDPSVLFIFASLVIGLTFNKTGLTKRMAYKMLGLVGEKTTTIYLGYLRFDRTSHAHHGTHWSRCHDVSVAPGHLRPVRRGRQTDEIRKRALHGNGLRLRSGKYYHSARLGPGHRSTGIFQRDGGQRGKFLSANLLHGAAWVEHGHSTLGLFLHCAEARETCDTWFTRACEGTEKDLGPMTRNEIITLVIVGVSIVVMSLQVMIPPLRALDKSAIFSGFHDTIFCFENPGY